MRFIVFCACIVGGLYVGGAGIIVGIILAIMVARGGGGGGGSECYERYDDGYSSVSQSDYYEGRYESSGSDVVICPGCDGQGNFTSHYDIQSDFTVCRKCGGSGWIKR